MTFPGVAWEAGKVRDFDPTIVLNFAFLTREKWGGPADQHYEAINHELIKRLAMAAGLPNVRLALTLSSGAALIDHGGPSLAENPYGRLKRDEEAILRDSVRPDSAWVIARGWSFSGPEVLRPADYLFSDVILQASRGSIELRSDRQVWRRYVSVEDFLSACLVRGLSGWSGVVDSGGDLIESMELAQRVTMYFQDVKIERSPAFNAEAPPDVYASDNSSWEETLASTGVVADDLDMQIRKTAQGLFQRGLVSRVGT
jgi:nucleoside-diphosphate-sugar epimerase